MLPRAPDATIVSLAVWGSLLLDFGAPAQIVNLLTAAPSANIGSVG
jgi:hypothetical protein